MADFFDEYLKAFCGNSISPINVLSEKLRKYADEIALYNEKIDLVSAKTADEILRRHILDSLCAVPFLEKKFAAKENFAVADAGSGAGFPGIPLAIAFPNVNFTLIERMSKRCAFLENAVAVLGLKNVVVKNRSVEECKTAEFDCVVFRAFHSLTRDVVQPIFSLLKTDGFFAAYKAKIANIFIEMRQVAQFVKNYQIFPLDASFLSVGGESFERNLVVASKI